ncbi:MAG TPA: hypothetical protein VGD14_09600 [bacterium]
MKRISVYTEQNDDGNVFEGWFDHDAATELAHDKYDSGAYKNGRRLLATAKKKLVINHWNNTGYDVYRFATDENEIAEILAKGGYDGDDKKLSEILAKYEI